MHVEGVLANNDYILNGCYIEITSNCNLRCIHCYNESGELRDQISVEAFKIVLGCYDNPKKASITLSGGEPLLHPQVWKFIDMMLESGILARNILLITNATCMQKSMLVSRSALMDRELSCMILFVEREILKEQWLACKGSCQSTQIWSLYVT